jgi:fused signal recognition particle receptor
MGIFDKFINALKNKDASYNEALSKTRDSINSQIFSLNKKYKDLNDKYFEELEEILINADIGVNTVIKFVDRLKNRVKKENIKDPSLLKEIIVDELFIIYVNNEVIVNKINYNLGGLTVILVVGVNGVGKTTSIAKLGYYMQKEHKEVMLIAADTFRAGAIEQLKAWGKKLQIPVFTKDDSDPASVVYDGVKRALELKKDVVLIDTAGRLHNKDSLMQELAKINKVITNIIGTPVHETLLVVDATTGQNGVSQAKNFKSIVDISGIVLTKIDGTAKGGIVLAIKDEVNIPVKFIGLGEKQEDLRVFDIENYIYGLLRED